MATSSSNSSILREYLVSLGFKVDTVQEKKFGQTLQGLDKKALSLGKSVLGVATAAQAMVAVWSSSFEKLYYTSRLANATAGNLKAMEFGASKVGVSGDAMTKALVAMNQAMRATGGVNGGIAGFLQSIGVQTTGRKTDAIFLDFLDQAAKYSPEIQNAWAQMFGIDPETMQLLVEGREQLRANFELQKEMAQRAGVDTEAAAEAGKVYAQTLKDIWAQLMLLKDVVIINVLPSFQKMSTEFSEWLTTLTQVIGKIKNLTDLKETFARGWKSIWSDAFKLSTPAVKESAAPGGSSPYSDFMKWAGSKKFASSGAGAGRGNVNPASVQGQGNENANSLFSRLESQYDLPAGLLDKVWKKESGRGRNMRSPAGAKGHFQFMDKTAAAYGVSNPDDLEESATGSAKMWRDLLKQYGGDLRKAAAGYNWGSGNIAKYGLGSAPAETRDYMDSIGGPAINQTTNITVNGSTSPTETARAIRDEQVAVNAGIVRNMKPRVQ